MLTRIWTGFLLSGLCASLAALVVVYMHEKGVYPFRDAWGRFSRQPWGRRIAIAAFVVGMWVYASVKPGDGGIGGDGGGDGGGTNNIQMVIGPGGLPQAGSPGAVTNTLDHGVVGEIRPIPGGVLGDPAPVVDEWSDFTPITSTNTTRRTRCSRRISSQSQTLATARNFAQSSWATRSRQHHSQQGRIELRRGGMIGTLTILIVQPVRGRKNQATQTFGIILI